MYENPSINLVLISFKTRNNLLESLLFLEMKMYLIKSCVHDQSLGHVHHQIQFQTLLLLCYTFQTGTTKTEEEREYFAAWRTCSSFVVFPICHHVITKKCWNFFFNPLKPEFLVFDSFLNIVYCSCKLSRYCEIRCSMASHCS